MLNPSIGKLINEYENRYDLVIDVARRARQISNRAEKNEEILTEKSVTLALNELADEKCK
ncbi:MAG: DNA-directed RNA polymerase subunit omega [Clostridia bacterium]|nr:DNA-directed RNA polymerase subunit omega [Clostridia bacterium]